MSTPAYKMNSHNKGEMTVLKPIAYIHAHLLSASLYVALSKNLITDV
jgi:hypothetical protein